MIRLVAFLGFGIFGVGKGNPDVILLQDIKYWDPVLAGRFHTDIVTVVFSKPVTQLVQAFRKGRKAGLLILCAFDGISNTNAGINPGFVDIKPTAIIFLDFKRQ